MTVRKRSTTLLLSLFILLLAACSAEQPGVPVTGETALPDQTPVSPGLPPEAVLNAQEWLATQLSVRPADAQIIDIEQAEWPDSCLGLGRANESCAAVMTRGWKVIFDVDGQRYEVRTDQTATTIRLASPDGAPGVAGVTLENTQWNLVSFGPLDSGTPVVEGSTVRLMLENGQAGGMGGCNSYGGTYTVEAGNISFGEITRTLRACADETVTQQEERYLQALQSASRYELEGNNLRIWYDDGVSVLVFETSLPAGPGGPLPIVETATPEAATATAAAGLPPEAVLDAQQWLAQQLGAGTEFVEIVETEQVEWSDSCLGLGGPNESCAQVITPGWRVIFESSGQRYEVRTDRTGSTIRLASPQGTPGA